MIDVVHFSIYAFIGMIAGFLGGLMGVGGGILVVPALLFAFNSFGFSSENTIHIAIGTSLAAMLFTTASSAYAHHQHRGIYWNIVKILTPGIFFGAILGSWLTTNISGNSLTAIFGCFVIVVGVYFFISKEIPVAQFEEPNGLILGTTGLFLGTISSFFGIGGGIITIPILTAMHVPIKNAIATSAFTGFLIATFGALSFLYLGLKYQTHHDHTIGYINIFAFLSISVTSVLFAPLGAKLSYRMMNERLKQVFGTVLILIGCHLIYGSVRPLVSLALAEMSNLHSP